MGARHSRLAASLAAAWEAEVLSARRLTAFADRVSEAHVKARLLVLAAFCRAHASRILARLAALGRGPLPVPGDDVLAGSDLATAFRTEIARATAAAARYETMADLARAHADLSSAWVCELNRSEEQDLVVELSRLLHGQISPAVEAPRPAGESAGH